MRIENYNNSERMSLDDAGLKITTNNASPMVLKRDERVMATM